MTSHQTIPAVAGVAVIEPHVMRLLFEDGVVRDVRYVPGEADGPLMTPLDDPAYFAQVSRLTREEHRSDDDALVREVEALRQERTRGCGRCWARHAVRRRSRECMGADPADGAVGQRRDRHDRVGRGRVALLRSLFGARSDVYAVRWGRVEPQDGLVTGNQRRLVQAAFSQGLPAVDR